MKKLYGTLVIALLAACSGAQQQSVQQGATDAATAASVMTKLTAIDVDATTAVHVSVSRGVATLTGTAKNAQEKRRYDDAARSANGVRRVVDRLQTNPHLQGVGETLSDAALAAKVQSAIVAQTGINGFHVTAHAHAGVVTLTGDAASVPVKQLAASAASKVNGVRRVIVDSRVTQ